MRILAYSDSLSCATGFGTVCRNLFVPMVESGFIRVEDFAMFGINYDGSPVNLPYPFRIWPATSGMMPPGALGAGDPYGRMRFIDMVLNNTFGPFDVLFLLLDHFSLAQPVNINNQWVPFNAAVVQLARQQPNRPPFRVVQYVPIDSEQIQSQWVNHLPSICDSVISYTEFGKRILLDTCPALKDKLRVINHGTNPELFFPLPQAQRDAFRAQNFGLKPGQPLILNLGRNQPRKDVCRSLQVFAKVKAQFPEAKLYLHMNPRDSMGFDLNRTRADLRLPADSVIFPANFNEGVGLPLQVVNEIYNAADVFVTTCRGGGWELPVSESMTVGLPVVAPDHTSFSELLADGRGILVPPEPERQTMISDNDQLRPVADVRAMADAVIDLLRNPDKGRECGRKAREWALRHSWKTHIVPQWKALFEELTRPEKPKLTVVPKRRLAFNAPSLRAVASEVGA